MRKARVSFKPSILTTVAKKYPRTEVNSGPRQIFKMELSEVAVMFNSKLFTIFIKSSTFIKNTTSFNQDPESASGTNKLKHGSTSQMCVQSKTKLFQILGYIVNAGQN